MVHNIIDLDREKQRRSPTHSSNNPQFSYKKFDSSLYTLGKPRKVNTTFIYDARYGKQEVPKVVIVKDTPLLIPDEQKQFCEDMRKCQDILPIFDWGLDKQLRPAIATEVAAGETLQHIIKKQSGNPLSLHAAADYTRQIAYLLDVATASRIRLLLRPEYIRVDEEGKVTLEIQKYGLEHGGIGEDTRYLSPELCKDPESSFTDSAGLYILGLLTYEMLSGSPPFTGDPLAVQVAHQQNPPPPLKHVSPAVARVVMKALEKPLQARYPGGSQEFVNLLQELVDQYGKTSRQSLLAHWLYNCKAYLPRIPGVQWLAALLKRQHPRSTVSKQRRELLVKGFKVAGVAAILVGTGIMGAAIEYSFTHKPEVTVVPRPIKRPTPDSLLPQQTSYKGHFSEVMKIAFSPDGQLVASGDRDGYIHIWDSFTGHRLFPIYDAHAASIVSITWYTDKAGNLYLISASAEGTLTLWTPDNYTIATYPSGKLPGKAIKAMARSNSDEHLVVAADESMVAFDFPMTKQFTLPDVTFEVGQVHTVAFSPVSSNIVACGGADATVKLWNIEKGTLSKSFDSEHGLREVKGMAWKPDGSLLATVGGELLLWDVNKGTIYNQYPDIQDTVNCIAWRNDTLFAIGSDNAIVQLLDIDGNLKGSYQHSKPVRDLAWSKDGRLLASASSDQTVQVRRVNF